MYGPISRWCKPSCTPLLGLSAKSQVGLDAPARREGGVTRGLERVCPQAHGLAGGGTLRFYGSCAVFARVRSRARGDSARSVPQKPITEHLAARLDVLVTFEVKTGTFEMRTRTRRGFASRG